MPLPVVLFSHGALPETLRMRHSSPFVILYERLIERQAVERVTRVALGNSQSKAHYLSRYERQSPTKFVDVPIGVDIAELQDRPRSNPLAHLPIASSDPVILFVGRLYPEKNPALFIEACDLLHGRDEAPHAVIIGDGIQSDLVRESMATREWLHWIPKLSRSNVLDAIALSSVLAITSRYESSPLVLLEALGLGTPVVSTPVGRASELIEEGVGRVAPANPNGVADAIRQVLSWNSEEVKTACLRLRHRIDFDATMSGLIRILREAGPKSTDRVARHGPSRGIA
jgi:glycosyltransferase involved in cell wall biosynthesis